MCRKKWLKNAVAIIMCIVMLATSIPFALAAGAGQYNPTPYFTDEAQQEGAAAWIDDDGNLQVRFPAATGRPTHVDWKAGKTDPKEISNYIIDITDLGGKLEAHRKDNSQASVLTKTVSTAELSVSYSRVALLSAIFDKAEVDAAGFDFENRRYNVSVTAVDTEGWFSMPISALISDVPEFIFDPNKFEYLSESGTAMREMLRFEKSTSDPGYVRDDDSIDINAIVEQVGTEDPATGLDTNGYRLRIKAQPVGGFQSIDIVNSRETWDFSGAEEIWYWMDLSEVELKGVSFRLRANEKRYTGNDRVEISTKGKYGDTVYSTLGTAKAGYVGEAPYVLVQKENGNWEKVMLKNGTVDLGHIKGYVRIPTKFFCAETDTSVSVSNQEFEGPSRSIYDRFSASQTQKNANAYVDEVLKIPSTIVSLAGTSITEALLVQQREFTQARPLASTLYYNPENGLLPGNMLAVAIDESKATDTNDSRRGKMVSDGNGGYTVENRDNAYKAIEDIYSAGIAYTGIGDDSVNKSLFIDNVMGYRTEGKWNLVSLAGFEDKAEGAPVSSYYNQKASTQSYIFDAIDEYIGTPSWTDWRGVHYVEDMLTAYRTAYSEHTDIAFLTDDALAARAAELGKSDTWQNYLDAKQLCADNGTLDSNNTRRHDLVPQLVRSLEALPDPSTVTLVSETLRKEIIKVYEAYSCLNYEQLKMFGGYVGEDGTLYCEDKLLAYIELLADSLDENIITGYKLANYPFIPFNTFEENTSVGDKAWQLENCPNYTRNNSIDWRQTKNFVTFGTNNRQDIDDKDISIQSNYRDSAMRIDAAKTQITRSGYNGSKGLTTTFDSHWLDGGVYNSGNFYSILMSRDSVTNDDPAAFRNNNMSWTNLSDLALDNEDAQKSDNYLPFSLVMYVDFTEFTDADFTFMPAINTVFNGELKKAAPQMGANLPTDKDYWKKYYLLDQQTGEWKSVYNDSSMLYMYGSTTSSQGGIAGTTLKGYKGYIAIPLENFKIKRTVGGVPNTATKMSNTPELLNTIYSVQFSITGGAPIDGKSFTIDNVGFTYDPDYYRAKGKGNVVNARDDRTYAEYFGAKSTRAKEFEEAVATIDPYDTATLAAKIDVAKRIYGYPYYDRTMLENPLADIQKEFPTVQHAQELLDKYIAYFEHGNTALFPPAEKTVDELKAAIAALPSGIADVSDPKNALPMPGYIGGDTGPREVNYQGFGFTDKAQAEEIASYYTNTYKRWSASQKAQLTAEERSAMLNAYNAAMRCLGTLEITKTEAEKFIGALQAIRYDSIADPDGTERHMLRIADRDKVISLAENEFDSLPYYAKRGLTGDANIPEATIYPEYEGFTDTLNRILVNTNTYNIDGKTVKGGILTLRDKYTALYTEARGHLAAGRTLPQDLLDRITAAIDEYNDLIPTYKDIFGLYYGDVQEERTTQYVVNGKIYEAKGTYKGIRDILDLFPVAKAGFAIGGNHANIMLNNDTHSETIDLNITYLAGAFRFQENSRTYFKVSYDGKLYKNDTDGNTPGAVTDGTYELSWNGVKVEPGTDVSIPADMNEGNTLKNNTYTADNKRVIKLAATIDNSYNERLIGKVTINQYRPADPDKGETEEILIGTYTVDVRYSVIDRYIVTIPAEVPVAWGDTADIDVSYKIACSLDKDRSKIAVSVSGATVSGNDQGVLKNDGVESPIVYSALNFKPMEFTGTLSNYTPTDRPTIKIAGEQWKNRPVARYSDILTYTVDYTTTNIPETPETPDEPETSATP